MFHPVLLRCESGGLLKETVKVGIIIISQGGRDVFHRVFGGNQQQLGFLHLASGDKNVGRTACFLFEDPDEVIFGHARLVGEDRQFDGGVEMMEDMGHGLLDAVVLDVSLGPCVFHESREEHVHDALRLYLVAKRAFAGELYVVDDRLMIVVAIGIGGGKLKERVDFAQAFHEQPVDGRGLDFCRESSIGHDTAVVGVVLIDVEIVMTEQSCAHITVPGVGRNKV